MGKLTKDLLIGGGVIAGTYASLNYIAKMGTEDESINIDNPYLDFGVHVRETRGAGQTATNYEQVVKPMLDKMLSFFGLIVLSPLFVMISIMVFINDLGPVFFTQKRIGIGKRYIVIHKFRTMAVTAPNNVPTHQLDDPDQYITKIGKVLRKTSLDELPQIWDIFRGRMSIIGPRPALWNQDDLVMERDRYGANDVMPGLTGLAQIKGRDELEISDKARLDGEYVKRLRQGGLKAFFFDVKMFAETLISVIKHDGDRKSVV